MGCVKGSCLCGAIRYECKDDFSEFHLCHCHQCQKVSGSAHVANLFTLPANIRWLSGENSVKRFDVPGRDMSSVFCETCGAPVPYLTVSKAFLIVPAGSLDTMPTLSVQDHIFWCERADWYDAVSVVKKFEKLPVN